MSSQRGPAAATTAAAASGSLKPSLTFAVPVTFGPFTLSRGSRDCDGGPELQIVLPCAVLSCARHPGPPVGPPAHWKKSHPLNVCAVLTTTFSSIEKPAEKLSM
jgi:hypothetical protein